MAAMIGSDGPVLWMVAVLLLLTVGLAGALLAATRSDGGTLHGGTLHGGGPHAEPGNRHLS